MSLAGSDVETKPTKPINIPAAQQRRQQEPQQQQYQQQHQEQQHYQQSLPQQPPSPRFPTSLPGRKRLPGKSGLGKLPAITSDEWEYDEMPLPPGPNDFKKG